MSNISANIHISDPYAYNLNVHFQGPMLTTPIYNDPSHSSADYDNLIRTSMLNKFYKSDYRGKELAELLEIAKTINEKISDEYVKLIEELTRDQCDSWLWEKQRVGRVTGSTFKLVCQTSLKKPAKSTIMKICHPEKCRFTSAATTYGKKMEPIARKIFVENMKKNHGNFTCSQTGLIIDPLCQFFAVSPDGTCSCDCCGKYLVEIKCPFCLSDPKSTVEDLLNLKQAYIFKENDSYQLNKKHPYYYQLQIQMAVCGLNSCYFYVWSPKIEIPPIEIQFEPNFWIVNSLKAFRFAKTVIAPELMNCYYTKTYA